jgi:hypothetical protein
VDLIPASPQLLSSTESIFLKLFKWYSPISNYVQSGFVLEKYKSSLELVDALKFESENYFDAGLIISTGIKFF